MSNFTRFWRPFPSMVFSGFSEGEDPRSPTCHIDLLFKSFMEGRGHRGLAIEAAGSKKAGRFHMKDFDWKREKYLVNRRKHGKAEHCLYALGRATSGKNYLLVFNLTVETVSPVDCRLRGTEELASIVELCCVCLHHGEELLQPQELRS